VAAAVVRHEVGEEGEVQAMAYSGEVPAQRVSQLKTLAESPRRDFEFPSPSVGQDNSAGESPGRPYLK
jgi:hypothetical protein